MNRLDRYILREILGPLLLGFLVYTFILLMQYLFSSAEMIIQRGLPLSDVVRLLWLVIPSTVVVTIPMSLLFAILIAIGRLASDSELIAMRAGGVSLLSLYRPILILSTLLALFNLHLMIEVLPKGNQELQQMQLEMVTRSVAQQVQPRVFHEEWKGKVLYVFDVPPGQSRWNGVFLTEALPNGEHDVIVAEWGEVRVDDAGERLLLHLENAVIHTFDFSRPDTYNVSRQQSLETILEDQFTSKRRAKISASKSIREMDLDELRRRLNDPDSSDEMRNLMRVQIHKNFAIPAACLVFGLLGLPLGFNNRRGGKTSGFAISIGIILVFWLLLSNGEEAARFGKLDPWIAIWSPNLLFGILGLFLLVRRNRDKSLLLSRIDRWVREDLWAGLISLGRWRKARKHRRREQAEARRRQLGSGRSTRLVVRLPQLRLRFPNQIDRYVVRAYLSVLGLAFLSGVTLYIVADLGENVDDILKNQIPRSVVFDYYKFLALQIVYTICPIIVLVTTLITFSLLTRTNEITAFKALGISLFRLSVPAIVLTALVVAFNVYLQSEVLPASNKRVAQLKNRIKGREVARTYSRADRQWLFGQGRYVYNYVHYDPQNQSLQRLQIFEFDEEYGLSRRLYAAKADFRGDSWVFDGGGWMRSFENAQVTEYRPFSGAARSDYPETPEYFTSEIRPPEQMNFPQLRGYIEELEQRGQSVPELEVELYNKISFPVLSLVMALVGLPFAFRLGRQGALYGVGLSVVLGMVFMAVFIFFSTLGKAGALPPLLAVWSPNLVFGTLALYLFLGVRT